MMKGELKTMAKIKVLTTIETIQKDGKEKTFPRYFSYVMIDCYENGEFVGNLKKSLEVHFKKDATKQLAKFTDKDQLFGIIEGDISFPKDYRIVINSDGKRVFPCNEKGEMIKPYIWVRNVVSYKETPYTPKESTCKPILDDEEDTEPVEIVE